VFSRGTTPWNPRVAAVVAAGAAILAAPVADVVAVLTLSAGWLALGLEIDL